MLACREGLGCLWSLGWSMSRAVEFLLHFICAQDSDGRSPSHAANSVATKTENILWKASWAYCHVWTWCIVSFSYTSKYPID